MIDQRKFLDELNGAGIDFFTGVPDSYLNGFCTYLLENISAENNIIAANEGNAIAIAAGYFFSTGNIPCVYMQNSGMGNTLNPLLSLTDKHVYRVPLVLLIGWRGEPNTGDWPQHKMQGEVTTKLLDLLEIPYVIAEDEDALLAQQVSDLVRVARNELRPVAIIGRKGVFAADKKKTAPVDNGYPLFREEVIEIVLDTLPRDTIYVATTGRATRELYFLRERRNEGHECDFLNVGSMGHASSVALGLALNNKNRRVVCFDGDSAALMHMGAFSMVSKLTVPNFIHIVLNNGAHDSVGGQPSAGMDVDFTAIASGAGYKTVGHYVSSKEEIVDCLRSLEGSDNATFIDVRIKRGLNRKLPSLDISHEKLINEFMEELK